MDLRPFGKSSFRVPSVGLGTSLMEKDPFGSVRAIHRGTELGLLHVDTAECYAGGRVEEIVGGAIAGSRRDGVFLVSKVLPSNADYDKLVLSCENSLRRLRTDRLDCYLLHHPSPHPLRQTVSAFEHLMDRGLIRSYGLSNFDVQKMTAFFAAGGRVACLQSRYNLLDRGAEKSVIPWCRGRGIAFVGHTPLCLSQSSLMISRLTPVAKRAGVSPWRMALSYLTRNPWSFVIPKSSNVDHVSEDLGAWSTSLSARDVEEIETLFPIVGTPRRPSPIGSS